MGGQAKHTCMGIIFMSIASSYCEVGWGGFGSVLRYGVIRECRVDYSKVKVLKHRFGRHKGFWFCYVWIRIEHIWLHSQVLSESSWMLIFSIPRFCNSHKG